MRRDEDRPRSATLRVAAPSVHAAPERIRRDTNSARGAVRPLRSPTGLTAHRSVRVAARASGTRAAVVAARIRSLALLPMTGRSVRAVTTVLGCATARAVAAPPPTFVSTTASLGPGSATAVGHHRPKRAAVAGRGSRAVAAPQRGSQSVRRAASLHHAHRLPRAAGKNQRQDYETRAAGRDRCSRSPSAAPPVARRGGTAGARKGFRHSSGSHHW